jgi:hypothetical protein
MHRKSEVEADVLYFFMISIVVQFSIDTERNTFHLVDERSTLTHASEKAVESYFALFRLLLCVATKKPQVVANTNGLVSRFMKGSRTKADCPEIGVLLPATLISDDGLTT